MPALTSSELASLAGRYDTPLWVYDMRTIRNRIVQLRSFDTVRYAQKANSNVQLLKRMRAEGVRVDAVSLGEIERAVRAGFQPCPGKGPAELVFTADVFDGAALERVVSDRIEVNAGSIDMLHQLGERSRDHRVWLRINPGFGHGHSKKTNTGGENSKHGIWFAHLPEALEVVRRHGLRLVGLHMHIGSGVDYAHLQRVCGAMVRFAQTPGLDLEAISAGGGLSVPYRPEEGPVDADHYFSIWNLARQEIARRVGHEVRLEIEPGRYLVAEAGVLVAEVRAVKQMGSNRFTLVDAGFSDLARPAIYGSYHEISVIPRQSGERRASRFVPTVVAGPLCESGDVFTQGAEGTVECRNLPEARVGDLLVFRGAGAYGAAMSSNYNSRLYAAEVLVDDDGHKLIRRRQTLEDLLACEAVDDRPVAQLFG